MRLFTTIVTATFLFSGFVSQAVAGPTLTATVNNNTPVTIEWRNPSCSGIWNPPFQDILAGQSQTTTNISPFDTSVVCHVEYRRVDNLKFCKWVVSRQRSTLTGPWNYPKVVTTKSSTGITCADAISSVLPNGNFSVTLTAQ